MTGTYEWVDSTVCSGHPTSSGPHTTTVALSVGGRPTNFATGPAVVGVASIADHVHRDHRRPRSRPPSALPAPHHRAHWGEEGVFPASMGRPQYPTPVGIYPVLAKERSVLMDSSSVGVPVDSADGYRMNVDYAVRITQRACSCTVPVGGQLPRYANVSHGCISLSPEDAEWYFDTVNVGDPVIVRDNSPRSPHPAQDHPGSFQPRRPRRR